MSKQSNVPPNLEAALRILAVGKPEAVIDLAVEAFRALKARDALIDAILRVATIPDEDRAALVDRCQALQEELAESQQSVLEKYS